IVAWSLLENYLGEQFGILVWAKLFWIPTILASILAAGYMWFRVFEDKELYPAEYLVVEKSYQFIAVSALFVVTIIFALSKNMELYALGTAVVSAFIAALTMTEIRKLPFKAIYTWGASLLIGTFLSGYINKNGLLKVKVTKIFSESTISKIMELVEKASNKKAKAENFITKFAKYYTPSVVILAVLLTNNEQNEINGNIAQYRDDSANSLNYTKDENSNRINRYSFPNFGHAALDLTPEKNFTGSGCLP
ncbi:MAG: hypothetical protein EOM23_09590, partial [Candidatus Moranbacteria bacterium]|nr:hypothetical protein [Candidatus Moranbacteria bacterium]